MAWDRGPVIGENSNDNAFDSSSVVKNRDGSVLERTEWIIDALGGPAIQVRAEKSISGTVEENSLQQFSIAIYDVDSGAVATGDIDITGISNVLMRSRAGGAFSSAGITQPTFAKGTGLVSCDYQFLAAEWQVGDMYKLNVKGITATVDGDTAYIPEMVWSNIVIEMEDLQATVGQQGSAADYIASANDSNIMAFIKAVLGVQVIAEGTLTTDSATVPADTTLGAAKATGYYDGKLLMTLTGNVAFQPKLITSYAGTTGVFTLDVQHPFTTTPGLVTYVILSSDISLVPAADQTTNTIPAHVVGNKADTIPAMNAAPSANDSIVRHAKAILERIGATPNDPDDSVLTNLGQRDDVATNDDMSDIATTSMEAKLRLILNRLSTDAFTANIQGSARTAIDTMLAQISAYFAAGGAVIASTVDPGGSSRVDLETILEDIGKILAGGGITTFPVGAAAADGVSMAAALRYASETIISGLSGGVATSNRAIGKLQMAPTTIDLNQVAATYTLFTGTTQTVVLEKLVFRLPNVDISGGSLTSISIQTDDVTPAVIISSADGVLANLTHEASITWTGAILIPVGTLVRLTIAGGVSGVACSCDVVAECRSVVNLGYLAV